MKVVVMAMQWLLCNGCYAVVAMPALRANISTSTGDRPEPEVLELGVAVRLEQGVRVGMLPREQPGLDRVELAREVILVDIAYNWNEAWLNRSDQAELDEGPGKGKKWLAAILVSCVLLYAASLAGIIIMYMQFGGCATNEAFISITLVMTLLCTAVQLTKSETGSLLTSACMTLYATYLCGTAVSKNPNAECNPKLGEISTWSIVLGLLICYISLLWVGWSWTTDKRLGGGNVANGNGGGEEEI